MVDPVQILWTPAGENLPSLGARALVDVTDGDTPNIRMPVRMLSIDTPEVTAGSPSGACRVDDRFAELVKWMKTGIAPVSARYREYLLSKLDGLAAGSLQYEQGRQASVYYKALVEQRLTRPDSTRRRNLFVRRANESFDRYGRLLAYVAPSYSRSERDNMSRRERATFNLDLVDSGWAAPFVLFPSIPGELDLPLFLDSAEQAQAEGRGQYGSPNSLPAYEYRMCEKLYSITRKKVEGVVLSWAEQLAWRSRYCADIRTRELFGPESYLGIPQPYRLWIWPADVQQAIGMLNLLPRS